MNDSLSCTSRRSYTSYSPMELISKTPIQKEIDLKIFDSQKRAPMSGCVYSMQRPLDAVGGQSLFKGYKKLLSNNLIGKLLSNNNLVPAHGYLNFPNGQNLGFGRSRGVRFETVIANSEAVGACANLADVLKRLPENINKMKEYHLTKNNCQNFAGEVAGTKKEENLKIIKDYAAEVKDRAKSRVAGALSNVKDAMIVTGLWTFNKSVTIAKQIAPVYLGVFRKIWGRCENRDIG